MAQDRSQETPSRIHKIGRAAALTGSVGLGVLVGGVTGAEAIQNSSHETDVTHQLVLNAQELRSKVNQYIEVSFNTTSYTMLDWQKMSLETQRAVADALVGEPMFLDVNTDDLRLYEKLVDPKDGHVMLDLNMNPDKYPQKPGKNFDGHPIELRVTKEQYEELKSKFGTVMDPEALTEKSFPGDIKVKGGTRFIVKVDTLPRGTDPRESYSQLVLQVVIPDVVPTVR